MKYLSPAKVPKAYMDSTVKKALGINTFTPRVGSATAQHYGFEVEIEGDGCQRRAENLSELWRPVRDGSLRGECIETIFSRPLTREEAGEAFDSFEREFEGFDDGAMSDRTSVHIHYDVSKRRMKDLQKMLVGFWLLEKLVFKVAGGVEREGNRFCLRVCDSETPLRAMIDGFQNGDVRNHINTRRADRYSNLNLQALNKFGSLEVRCHKGSVNAAEMRSWLAVIDEIFTVSRTFNEAREIIERPSEIGTMQFLESYFPITYAYTADVLDREELIYDCLDHAQMLAYCVTVEASGPLKKKRSAATTANTFRSTAGLGTVHTRAIPTSRILRETAERHREVEFADIGRITTRTART